MIVGRMTLKLKKWSYKYYLHKFKNGETYSEGGFIRVIVSIHFKQISSVLLFEAFWKLEILQSEDQIDVIMVT